MTTNVPGTRPANRPDDPVVVETTPTPVVNPTGVNSVAVYDQVDSPSASIIDDPAPIETRSNTSIMTWVIGAIVLIVLAYFLLQIIF